MIRQRRTLIGMAAIGTLLLILFFSLPFLIEVTLKYQLTRLGMLDPVVNINQVGLDEASISTLGFSHSVNGHRVELMSHNIDLHYRLVGLLTGQIDRVIIATADIKIDKQSDPVKDVRHIKKATVVPEVSAIPFHSFHINKARIFINEEDQDSVRLDASGSVQKSNGGLEASLNVIQEGYSGMQANMALTQTGSIKVSVHDLYQHNKLLNLQAEKLTIVDDFLNMQLKAQADFAKIVELLHAWGLAKEVNKVSGSLDINADMHIPMNTGSMTISQWLNKALLRASVNLDMTAQQWSGIGQDLQVNIPLTVSIKEGLLSWEFNDNTQFKMIPEVKSYPGVHAILQDISKTVVGQRLAITFPGGLSGQANTNELLKQENIKSGDTIKLVYGEASDALRLELLLQSPLLIVQPKLLLNSEIIYSIKIPKSNQPLFGSVSTHGRGLFTVDDEKTNITLKKGAELSVGDIRYDDIKMNNAGVSLNNPAQCRMHWANKNWSCSPFALQFILSDMTSDALTVNANKGLIKITRLARDQSGLDLKTNIQLSNLRSALADYTLKLDSLQANIGIKKSTLDGKAILMSGKNAITAETTLKYDLESSRGAIDYHLLPVDFSAKKSLLEKIVVSSRLPVQISAGIVSAQGRYTWKPAQNKAVGNLTSTLHTAVSLRDVNGQFKNIDFKGLSSELMITGNDDISFKQPANVQIALLDAGVPVTDIKFIVDGNIVRNKKPVIIIDKLLANAFDGRLESRKIHLDLNSNSNPFVINFHQLNVSKLLQLEQDQGLSGTGLIDGVLPFDYRSEQGLFMLQGKVNSRAPGGVLKYDADDRVKSMASGNANMKMLLDALNNFNYSKLDAGADYTPDGKLSLKVRLEGKNPEFQQGRPVHLNVNIEENILQLIRSLQLGEELGDKIGERVIKH